MSKNLITAALGITLSGVGVFAAIHPFETFRLSPEKTVTRPAAPAAADSSQNKFDDMQLLKGGLPLSILDQKQDWTTVVSDSAGLLQFPEASRSGILRTLTTRVRSPRFAKGTLKLRSNVRAEVLVDGRKVATHATADSVPGTENAQLELEPEKTALVQINFLSMPGDPVCPQLGLSFETSSDADSLIVSGPETDRRFSIETTTLGSRVSSVELSPDGKYLMVAYSNTTDGKNYNYWTEIQESSSSRVIFTSTESLSWMPKGAMLYQTRKALDGNGYEIIKRDPRGASSEIMARVASDRFYISPDEKYIIYYEEKKGKEEKGPMIRIKDPDDRMPGQRDANYLVRQDISTGIITPLTYGGPSTWLNDIAPDGSRIIYTTTRKTPSVFPFYASCLVEMDMNTLATDTLASGVGESGITSAIYSPDGKKLFITAGPEAFGGIGRNAGDFEYANEFDVQGFIFDLATRKPTPVTRDFNPSIQGEPIWNRADGKIYFRAEEGFYSPVYCFDPVKGTFTKLATDIEYSRGFSVGKYESRWLATTGTSYHYAGRATLLDLKTGKSHIVADPYASEMASIELGKEEPWTFTAADGSLIDGIMVLPPDFDPSRKYPLIVYYYGGTSPSSRGMTNPYTPHLFASRDYVVYVLNPSGTPGYGQEFSARHVNAWGDWTADEIIEGVKKFCKEHPYVDSDKIGCLGASYGGFMTQYLLTKTDIFAAAVSHAGISNVTSYWGEGYWGYSYNAVAAAKSYPWTNPDLFTRHGSLFNADKIHTPLLLLHGNKDTNVPVGESIQLFNALQILGRKVELIEVDGENHFIADYEKRKLWHATIMAWFARWLKDDPAWWDSMYE